MRVNQAKNIINLLSQKWKIKDKDFFSEIINYLNKKAGKEYSFRHEFEFSLVENEPRIKLLHLDFWQPNLSPKIVEKIIRERERVIISVVKKINLELKCLYNLSLLRSFFQFNKKTGLWPVQFGFEYQKESKPLNKPKLKVYLSINKTPFPLKKFCQDFNLNSQVLYKKFEKRGFDTVAIDFLPDGDFRFKFYPMVGPNKGKLYRVDKNTKIISIKNWLRFPYGLLIDDKIVSNFIKLPTFLYEIIKNNNFKIHYFCEENGKKSIYFR